MNVSDRLTLQTYQKKLNKIVWVTEKRYGANFKHPQPFENTNLTYSTASYPGFSSASLSSGSIIIEMQQELHNGDHTFILYEFILQSKKISMRFFIYPFGWDGVFKCPYVFCIHINRFEMPALKSDFKSYSFRMSVRPSVCLPWGCVYF